MIQEVTREVSQAEIDKNLEAIDKPKEKGPANCKKCGWEIGKEPATPSQQDIEEFLKSVLSCTNFNKTYNLFGNKVTVVLRSRTVTETDLILRQTELDRAAGKFNMNPALFFSYVNKYQLLISLVSVTSEGNPIYQTPLKDKNLVVVDKPELMPKPNSIVLKDLEDALYSKVQDTLFAVLMSVQRDFEYLTSALTARAQDPNFWKTVG